MTPAGARLPPWHALLARAVVAVWGTNFIVIKIALGALPPLLLAVLRFAFARHPAATVAPMALGVPVFGMLASALVLGEALPPWKLGAAALVLAGLALNLFWPRRAGTG